MQTAIIGAMFTAIALSTADAEQAEQPSPPEAAAPARKIELFVPAESSVRNLLLRAFGSGEEKPGQLRVPIPTEQGTMYEIIIEKPGLPRSVPAIERTKPDR